MGDFQNAIHMNLCADSPVGVKVQGSGAASELSRWRHQYPEGSIQYSTQWNNNKNIRIIIQGSRQFPSAPLYSHNA